MKKRVAVILLLSLIFAALSSCSADSKYPMDDAVYKLSLESKDYVHAMINNRAVYFNVYDSDNKFYACSDSLCSHSDSTCPGYSDSAMKSLVVDSEDREMPLLFIFGHQDYYLYKDGELVQNPDALLAAVKELDMNTNEGRIVNNDLPFTSVFNAFYYNGVIYVTAFYTIQGSRIGALDVATGEYTELDFDQSCKIVGIYDDKIYFITQKGVIKSCDLALENCEEVYDSGVGYIRPGGITPMATLEDGKIYIEKNSRAVNEAENVVYDRTITDVYCLELENTGAGAKLFVEGARTFYPYNGDLYYTQWDYTYYGKFDTTQMGDDIDIYSESGGTLYKYDGETGQSSVFVENCGADFASIYEINENHILFGGYHYDDIPSLGEGELYSYGMNTLLMYRFETGTYEIILETMIGDVAIQ